MYCLYTIYQKIQSFPSMLGQSKTTTHKASGLLRRRIRLEVEFSQEPLILETAVERNYISLLELEQNQLITITSFRLDTALGFSLLGIAKEVDRTL
jgi:hypothetical protein